MLRRMWQSVRDALQGPRIALPKAERPYLPLPPHPANVPGPFYVENGCCMSCAVPESVAPELFGWLEDEPHCYVKRQPESPEEMAQMLEAMCSSEADCIRARSCSPEFLLELSRRHCENLVDTA
jgi:hypothetical protein